MGMMTSKILSNSPLLIHIHLLMEGRPMIDFEGLKLLFKQLGVKTTLKSSRLIVQHGSWLNNYTKC
jgi:hypothetical protein